MAAPKAKRNIALAANFGGLDVHLRFMAGTEPLSNARCHERAIWRSHALDNAGERLDMVAGFVDGVLLASDAGHVDHAHVGANLRGTETPMQSNARTVDAILNRAFAEVRGQRSTSAG